MIKERIVQTEKSGWCRVERRKWWFPFWYEPMDIDTKGNYFSSVQEAQRALEAERKHPFKKKILWQR